MLNPVVIVTIVFSAIYFLMVLYFFINWLRLKPSPVNGPSSPGTATPFVSIIIPTRNESGNIVRCLESIFKQTYPASSFEVILIDDYSTDPTLRLAREFTQPNLTVLDLQQYLGAAGEYIPNKKKAIALGVKNAKGEIIITTDGDCYMEENWLGTLVQFYQANDYKLVTGPVMIKPARSPFAWFQQLDVITLLGVTGATIRSGLPTMCNGANLMYSKKVFHEVEGFKGNHDLPTGDDIFLMQKINSRYPNSIGFLKNYDACVFTGAEKSLGGFISQRVRWLSKSRRFGNFKVGAILYFTYLFNLLVLGTAFNLLNPMPMNWLPLAIAGGAKLFADLLFQIPVTIFFRKAILLLLLPVIEVFHILYIVFIGAISLVGRYRWKDRMVK